MQVLFHDQPGLLDPRHLMDRAMREAALGSVARADGVLYLVPAGVRQPEAFADLVPELTSAAPTPPVVLVRTMIDRVRSAMVADRDLAVSARTGAGVEAVWAWCVARTRPGPFRYDPEDVSTDPMRFFVSEFIREAAFELLDEELPYALAAEVDEFREDSQPVYIRVTIVVERESQKRMVIGRGGRMIKRLGSAARARIEELVGGRVYLDLWVKVLPRWRKRPAALARFGLPVTEEKPS